MARNILLFPGVVRNLFAWIKRLFMNWRRRTSVLGIVGMLWSLIGNWSTAEFLLEKLPIPKTVAVPFHIPTLIAIALLVVFTWILVHDLRRDRSAQLGKERPSEPNPSLPEKRPKVVPSRYGDASGNATGETIGESLVLDNDGEPAFDVSVEPIEFGGWTLRFDGIARLTKTAECPAHIRRGGTRSGSCISPGCNGGKKD